jgi:hypothetical protein
MPSPGALGKTAANRNDWPARQRERGRRNKRSGQTRSALFSCPDDDRNKPMPSIDNPQIDQFLRVLALLALLFYLAPGVFGRGSPTAQIWLRRAAVACLTLGVVIALAATVAWFLR